MHLVLTMAVAVAEQDIAYNYHFLIEALNRDYEKIKVVAANNNNTHVHFNVEDMKSLISSRDLVVSAVGSTLYEICACGVQLITHAMVDNQIL